MNTYTLIPFYLIPDQLNIRDQFSKSILFSAMDLKSGFLNIRVHPDTVGLLGLVCHEGLFVGKRMAFGLLGAPMWFQYVVDTILG